MGQSQEQLSTILECAYAKFHSEFFRRLDPIHIVHEYKNPKDQEVVAFLSALLAYGNVTTIVKSIRQVLAPLGTHPHRFVREKNLSQLWNGFYHRFTRGEDIETVFFWIQSVLRNHKSLEDFFMLGSNGTCTKTRLSSFVKKFIQQPLPPHLQSALSLRSRNLKHLISDPERGSACKRLNLFLRWVVRPKDKIDLGLWQGLKPSQLILPLDTHLLQTLQNLGWTQSSSANWRVAENATEKLKVFCPEDPLRYDFALCHLSMHGFSILESDKKWGPHAKVE